MFGAAGPLPQAFWCGKGTAPVSGPAGRAVSRPPCRGRFQPRRPLCSGGVDGTCPVRAVLLHNSIPIGRKSQWVFRQGRGGSPRRPGNAGVRPCACPIFRRPSAARAAAPQKRRAGAGGGRRMRRYAVKGLVLGLTISRQSRSPRAPPDAAHRAGTPVICNAAGESEFRRPSAARAAAPQKRRAGAGGGRRMRRYAVKGLVLGLTISRQSRSPRAPPDAAHRAGTPVICNAAGESEFRRPSAARAAAPQKRRAGAGGGRRMRRYAVKGLVLGLTISRQSRSPRSRPWMRISAVATLVA